MNSLSNLQPRRIRPISVTLVAALFVLSIINNLFTLFTVGTIFYPLLHALAAIVLGILLLWGLWSLRPWAFWLLILYEVGLIGSYIIMYITAPESLRYTIFLISIIGVCLCGGVILMLLLDRSIRNAMGA